MGEYLDSEGRKMKKGFYRTIPIRQENLRMSDGGEIHYFTGKFDEKGYPLVISIDNIDIDEIYSYSKHWVQFLERINPEEINKKINKLEVERNWFKAKLKDNLQNNN